MQLLMESIRTVGIKVPLSVYPDGKRYVLIDGERRWRCARKLNMPDVPAIVQPKPERLENILTMFNIHNVRSDWDLMPTAYKLRDVQELLGSEGRPARAKELAGLTGLPLPTVRRALELLELPQRYQDLLMAEAEKPKDQQRIKVDLFVEINKAKNVVERYQSRVFKKVSSEEFVDAMVEKYLSGVVKNVVAYRELSKIARVERTGADDIDVATVIIDLVRKPKMSIADAYAATVEAAYAARDLTTRAVGLVERLRGMRKTAVSADLRARLLELRDQLDRLLG